jgi:RND superfamily putative drug exporter
MAPTPPLPTGHVRELHPTGIFAAVGRFDYRFRRWLPIVGLAIVIGFNAWAAVSGGTLIQGGWVIDGSEEQQAAALIADRFGSEATTMLVVYHDPNGNAASPDFQATVKASLARVAEDSAVTKVQTYADTKAPALLSSDGTMTMAAVFLDKGVEEAVNDAGRLADEVEHPSGVQMWITGIPQVYHEFNAKIERDLFQAEAISLPIALLILLAVFGTLVGAALPLVIAGLAMPTAFAAISLLANVTEMSIFVTNIATMIGLALAIDYSLFMVSRFREELRHHDVEIALERMMGSVGKAVAVSGIAVAVGLSSLVVFDAAALRSMGLGGIITVLSTLVFGLTVLPALLALLGPRVNRLRVPLPRFLRLIEDDTEAADRRQGRGVWAWIAARVMRRPLVVAIPVLAILLVAGSPFLGIQLSTGQNLADLPPVPSRIGFEVIQKEFPGGESDPIAVAMTWPGGDFGGSLPPERQDQIAAYARSVKAVDPKVSDVESVLTPPPGLPSDQYLALLATPAAQRPAALNDYVADWLAVDTTKLRVFSEYIPDSDDGRALVDRIRAIPPPEGTQVLTGGLPSRSADFMRSFLGSVPIAILIVVLVTMGVLFLTFGSVFLPVKAVLMSLISATGDNTRAVAEGIGLTGGMITGAALIMVAVFAAFGMSSITSIKSLGVTMSLAVLIDATIVRGLLVPAFMRVMGRVNWWAPAWLQRTVARLGLYEVGSRAADAAR